MKKSTKRPAPKKRRPTRPEATEVVVLPRGADAPDDDLVEDAVTKIRGILGHTLAKGMEDVGAYLLKTFYDDDPGLYASASPRKHASLRTLMERCGTKDLPVSTTFLSNAIRMAIVSRQLPKGAAFGQLPVSHRVELLRLPTTEQIEDAAQDIIDDDDVTVRSLRDTVTKMLGRGGSGRGRPRTPPVVRAVNQVAAALRKEESWHLAFQRADIDALDDGKRAELEETVERVSTLLGRLQKLLAKR
ncbi:MAG: hypothetical protein AB7S26_30645 [Sandaracinaceae bacterium]